MAEPESSGLWHAALFHRGAGEFETRACQFVEAAARADAAVLVVGAATALSGLRARLNGLGKHVTWADMAETSANPGRLISAISRFADAHPGRPTWCVQQAAWPTRPAEELWEVLRHEALLNLALAHLRVRLLCPYDSMLPAELISCASTTHPMVSAGDDFQSSPGYRGDAPGTVPEMCDLPLLAPPPTAWVLPYIDDLSAIRHWIRRYAQEAGLTPLRGGDLQIAVGELAANTLAHTTGPGTLTVWTTGAEIVCQITDAGYITDPLAGRVRPGPAAARGGRGLWLVHELCDFVQIRTGPAGTTIRVHMRLARALRSGRRVIKMSVTSLTASVTIEDSGPEPYTLVELAGEADVTGSETLQALLEEQTRTRPRLLIVEMSSLRFMDSSALQAILRAHLVLGKHGGRLALVSPHDTVARVLQMTEVDRIVPVYASVAQALLPAPRPA